MTSGDLTVDGLRFAAERDEVEIRALEYQLARLAPSKRYRERPHPNAPDARDFADDERGRAAFQAAHARTRRDWLLERYERAREEEARRGLARHAASRGIERFTESV